MNTKINNDNTNGDFLIPENTEFVAPYWKKTVKEDGIVELKALSIEEFLEEAPKDLKDEILPQRGRCNVVVNNSEIRKCKGNPCSNCGGPYSYGCSSSGVCFYYCKCLDF